MTARQDKSKTIARLRKALDKIPELQQQNNDSTDFKKWQRDTRIAIERSFGNKSQHKSDFIYIQWSDSMMTISGYDRRSIDREKYLEGLESASVLLESMIDEVEEYWEENEPTTSIPITNGKRSESTNKVFLIHGRDEGTRDTVAIFLGQLGLEPVILAEQASQGKTIIEKFESHAQVGFAIALLTPDDTGSLSNDVDTPRPRARQNVIFELGFFIGCLGRERVCALTKGKVQIPSDYSGVVYIPLDDGDGWKLQLVRELKTAGFTVDANRAL